MALSPQETDSRSDKKKKREEAQQDVFLREVDEALRQDEMLGFASRFGKPILFLVVLGLAGFGGYLWWQENQKQEAEKRSEDFIVAMDDLEANKLADADGKLNPLANAKDKDTATAVAAKLLRAGIALEQKHTKEAVKLYSEVAADAKAPQPYRDLATVRAVAADFDALKPQEVIDRLKPLAVPGNPWFGVAGELVGIAYLKQDKKDLAGPLFAKIAKDEDMPETLRQRSRQMAGSLGVDALDDVIGDDADKKAKQGGDEAADDGEKPAD